ncbi:MAG TPA: serine/threonine-protein kinase, partial [Elusimicrobia bacterium]|nr:serine/threonine-protein kinase [Elusimicrobiota bacterium]
FADSAVATAALLSEARAAARLEDPHIVQVYDANQEGDLVYVVMQYVIGMSLGQKVSLEGPLPQDEALRIMKEVAAGLVVA